MNAENSAVKVLASFDVGPNKNERLDAHSWQLLGVLRSLEMLTGFCYTQFADTYQETNGLLFADRRPKIPLDRFKAVTLGPSSDRKKLVRPSLRSIQSASVAFLNWEPAPELEEGLK